MQMYLYSFSTKMLIHLSLCLCIYDKYVKSIVLHEITDEKKDNKVKNNNNNEDKEDKEDVEDNKGNSLKQR